MSIIPKPNAWPLYKVKKVGTCHSHSESLQPSPRQYLTQCDFREETRTCTYKLTLVVLKSTDVKMQRNKKIICGFFKEANLSAASLPPPYTRKVPDNT